MVFLGACYVVCSSGHVFHFSGRHLIEHSHGASIGSLNPKPQTLNPKPSSRSEAFNVCSGHRFCQGQGKHPPLHHAPLGLCVQHLVSTCISVFWGFLHSDYNEQRIGGSFFYQGKSASLSMAIRMSEFLFIVPLK